MQLGYGLVQILCIAPPKITYRRAPFQQTTAFIDVSHSSLNVSPSSIPAPPIKHLGICHNCMAAAMVPQLGGAASSQRGAVEVQSDGADSAEGNTASSCVPCHLPLYCARTRIKCVTTTVCRRSRAQTRACLCTIHKPAVLGVLGRHCDNSTAVASNHTELYCSVLPYSEAGGHPLAHLHTYP
uniref:Uncharacterized protein n=1 Tax=Eutreptiella gymnastica TaxID=73025 RepID=A0A7S4FPD7_9EUGL